LPVVQSAVDEVVELAVALLIVVGEGLPIVAAGLQGLVRGGVGDLGQVQVGPVLPLLLLLVLERALEFVVVDGLEGLAVVEGGVLGELNGLNDPGVDLLVQQLAVVLLQGVIHPLQFRVLFH
jgi:hypothetical protein